MVWRMVWMTRSWRLRDEGKERNEDGDESVFL
jgi:hypothetical protein